MRASPSAVTLTRATLGALNPSDPMIPCLCVKSARPSETGDLPLGKAARCCVARAARGGDTCSLLLQPGRRILPPSPRVPEGFVSPWPTAGRQSRSRAAKPHDTPPGTTADPYAIAPRGISTVRERLSLRERSSVCPREQLRTYRGWRVDRGCHLPRSACDDGGAGPKHVLFDVVTMSAFCGRRMA